MRCSCGLQSAAPEEMEESKESKTISASAGTCIAHCVHGALLDDTPPCRHRKRLPCACKSAADYQNSDVRGRDATVSLLL